MRRSFTVAVIILGAAAALYVFVFSSLYNGSAPGWMFPLRAVEAAGLPGEADGCIYYCEPGSDAVMRQSAPGREPDLILRAPANISDILLAGDKLAFTVDSGRAIYAADADGGEAVRLAALALNGAPDPDNKDPRLLSMCGFDGERLYYRERLYEIEALASAAHR